MQATLTLSPLFVNKLNKLGSDLNGANGRQNVPTSTYDFLQRLKDVLSSESPIYIPYRLFSTCCCFAQRMWMKAT